MRKVAYVAMKCPAIDPMRLTVREFRDLLAGVVAIARMEASD